MIHSSEQDWDMTIFAILFSYRTAVQSSTNFTPFMLFHNREARLPLDIKMKHSDSSKVAAISTNIAFN